MYISKSTVLFLKAVFSALLLSYTFYVDNNVQIKCTCVLHLSQLWLGSEMSNFLTRSNSIFRLMFLKSNQKIEI